MASDGFEAQFGVRYVKNHKRAALPYVSSGRVYGVIQKIREIFTEFQNSSVEFSNVGILYLLIESASHLARKYIIPNKLIHKLKPHLSTTPLSVKSTEIPQIRHIPTKNVLSSCHDFYLIHRRN